MKIMIIHPFLLICELFKKINEICLITWQIGIILFLNKNLNVPHDEAAL
jgi:hypothetical protein